MLDLEANPLGEGNSPEREIPDQLAYVPEPFVLTVGLEYRTLSKEILKIVYETKNRFLGVIELPNTTLQLWYTKDGYVERNFDESQEPDPFDVKSVHRDPDMIFLIRKNGSYTSNNCFMSMETALKAAAERGGYIVPFKEVMDD